MIDPVFFQFFHGKPSEQFFLALEIGFDSRYEQAFPEAARAAQEIVAAGFNDTIDKFGFIDIEITAGTKLFEVLYAYRINFIAHNYSFYLSELCIQFVIQQR